MNFIKIKLSLAVFLQTLGALFFFINVCMFLDSTYIHQYFSNNQWLANLFGFGVFLYFFIKATNKVKKLIIYATLIGIFGEYLFSLGLEMYTYRQGNVPFYVPPGHAIVYISTYYFSKHPTIKQNQNTLYKYLSIAAIFYGTLFLIFKNDVFGFILTILTVLTIKNRPKERLFFITMYWVVVYLEIIGTSFQCWQWPATAYGYFSFLPSANPPSGISFYYFLLDLGTLWMYKQFHLKTWKRMKNIRLIQQQSIIH